MFGNTYFCRFEEVLGLNPAFRAVFNKVFLANPLQNYKYWSMVKLIIQHPNNFTVCKTAICGSSVPTSDIPFIMQPTMLVLVTGRLEQSCFGSPKKA
jgi:hypothetical protein